MLEGTIAMLAGAVLFGALIFSIVTDKWHDVTLVVIALIAALAVLNLYLKLYVL